MRQKATIFIRPEFRPDLRAVQRLGAGAGSHSADPMMNCFSTLPQSFVFKGCVEKNSNPDKDKEVSKDDQARGPVRDRSVSAREGAILDGSPGDCVYTTIFA